MLIFTPRYAFFGLVWLFVAAGGLVAMSRYEHFAGPAGSAPSRWPVTAELALDSTRATLLMFAHPKCPCSRASVEELNRLLTQCGSAVVPHLLFFTPENASRDWVETDLWRSAAAIPGLKLQADRAGTLAQRFGAETSGHVVLYDPSGQLLFQGGITPGRGHAGDNAGAHAILARLSARPAPIKQTPTFGCSLSNADETPQATASCTKP